MTEVVISTTLAPEWNRRAAQDDLSQASEGDLRYEVLLGDVELRAGDVDLGARWGWVPLLDFVLGIVTLLGRLRETREEVFEFTESGAELRFYLDNGEVEIRSNYASGVIRTDYTSLVAVVTSFAGDSVRKLRDAAPSLERNTAFQRMLRELSAA